jgi:hypothetical protein
VLLELLLLARLSCCAYALDLHPVCVVLEVLSTLAEVLNDLRTIAERQ